MELYKRIKQLSKQVVGSEAKLAAILGLRQNQFNGYLNPVSQRNLWEHLPVILAAFPQVRRNWLYFGEGEMLKTDTPAAPPPVASLPVDLHRVVTPQSIPIAGFASCGMSGWNGCMTYPLAVPAPHMRPDMIAVMATGESMLPEGIGHGHICFCDPHVAPIPGECVYVTHRDKMATLKAFVGTVQMEGGTGYRLQGWQDKMNGEPQKHFYLDVLQSLVVTLAPVVYVQRRL